MVDEFTAPELAALRVSLADLPIDPTGLDVYVPHYQMHTICVLADDAVEPDLWLFCAEPGAGARRFARASGEIDLADTSAADRVARWAARKVEIPSSCGVIWHSGFSSCADSSGWILYGTDGEDYADFFVSGDHEQSPLRVVNPDDGRRLPDGSRYVDRLALARWVVTLAGRAT